MGNYSTTTTRIPSQNRNSKMLMKDTITSVPIDIPTYKHIDTGLYRYKGLRAKVRRADTRYRKPEQGSGLKATVGYGR